jgi:hypothetical protein
MSGPKFAPMTSALLARKGEALPSLMSQRPRWDTAQPLDIPERSVPPGFERLHRTPFPVTEKRHEERHGHAPDGSRKLFLRLSPEEYEKLGIAAVKKNLSRNDIVRDAVNAYIAELIREYQDSCGCIAGCGSGCGDRR